MRQRGELRPRSRERRPPWLAFSAAVEGGGILLISRYVKASRRDGLRYVKQEPNRESLWNKIKYNTVTPFLLRLYQEGAFGPGTPADVFTVVCSPENNPLEEIVLGNLQVEVYFFPSRPAETIIIIVGQQESGATASER